MTQGSDFNQRPRNDGMNKYDDMMLFVRICVIVILIATLLRVYGRIILQCTRFIRRSRQRSGFMQHQFYFTGEEPTTLRNVGLDSAILETLPKFVYRSQIGTDGLECAVCLCEWEENEKGRLLPNCGHSFHVECIDMWLLWDSTCPLCRTVAQPEHPVLESARIGQVSATIPTPIASGLDPNLNSEQGQTASSEEEYDPQYSPPNTLSSCGQDQMNVDMDEGTAGGRALMPHIAIDIPKRPHVFWSPGEGHMPNDSQSSSKAPVSDLRSLTNQFTRDSERKISPSDHPGERDLEHDGAAQSQ